MFISSGVYRPASSCSETEHDERARPNQNTNRADKKTTLTGIFKLKIHQRSRAQSALLAQLPQNFGPRKFKPGDLVYGPSSEDLTDEGRGWYKNNRRGPFRKTLAEKTHFKPYIRHIDQYAVLMLEKIRSRKKSEIPPDEQEFLDALKEMEKYRSAINDSGEKSQSVARKCKGGLEWAIRQTDKHVHFVLDGLEMHAVVGKSHESDTPKGPARVPDLFKIPLRNGKEHIFPETVDKNRALTGSELRWVYRNRHDPMVREKVHFYLDKKPAAPPWTGEGREVWERYQPRHN